MFFRKDNTGAKTEEERPNGTAGTNVQIEAPVIENVKRGSGWLKENEKVIAEFGGAHVYDKAAEKAAKRAAFSAGMAAGAAKHPIGGGYVSRQEVRNDYQVRNAQDAANDAKASAERLRVDSARTVVTDSRLVFLDKDENILLELTLGLENVKKRIQGIKAANEEAKRSAEAAKKDKGFFDKRKESKEKYGYKSKIIWACDAVTDNNLLGHQELVISSGHFDADMINRFFNPKYSESTMRRGWKYTPNKSIIYGPSMDYNVKLSEPEKVEELIRLLNSMASDAISYTHSRTDMIVDFLGRKPDWLV